MDPGGVLTAIHRREEKFLRAVMQPDETHGNGICVNACTNGLPALMAELGHIIAASGPRQPRLDPAANHQNRDTRPTSPANGGGGRGLSATDCARGRIPRAIGQPWAALSEGPAAASQDSDHLFAASSSVATRHLAILSFPPGGHQFAGPRLVTPRRPALQTLLDPRQPPKFKRLRFGPSPRSGDLSAGAVPRQSEVE